MDRFISKIKVGFIIPQFINGGAERVVSDLITGLPSDNFDKYLILYDADRLDYPYDGKLISLNSYNTNNPIKKIVRFIKRIYGLRKIKTEYKLDYCVSFLDNPNIINILTPGKTKTILTVHTHKSSRKNGIYGIIYHYLIMCMYNFSDKVICVSKGIEDDLKNNFKINQNKLSVIYNCIKNREIEELSAEELSSEEMVYFQDKRVIVNVGRLVEAKGQWHLLKAFKEILKKTPNAFLVIVGEGNLEVKLKELATNLAIDKNIFFAGYNKNPFKFISRAELFISSSVYEGFGLSILEAMCCKIPVISTDCKVGPSEIMDFWSEVKENVVTEFGILTLPGDKNPNFEMNLLTKDEESLVQAVDLLFSNKELCKKISENCNKRVDFFSLESNIRNWMNILH